MILTIAWRELRALFLSPLAWVVLAVVQAILGWFFAGQTEQLAQLLPQLMAMNSPWGVTEIIVPDLLSTAAIVLLLVVPLLTMRLMAEERRNRTLGLLFSAPISMTEIVLGKYLGVMLFLLLLVLLIALMPLSLLFAGGLDYGLVISGFLGLTLVVAGFAAVGLFMSTLTQHPIVAAIAAFGALLMFWILDVTGRGDVQGSVLASLSLFNHYQPFLRGVVNSADAAYHALLILTFLMLSIRRLDAARLGG